MASKRSMKHVSSSSELLPQELMEYIAKRLGTRTDICNFRAVCTWWLKSAPMSLLHPPKPLLNPLFPLRIDTTRFNRKLAELNTIVIVAFSVCIIRPLSDCTLPPWLVAVEEFNHGKLFLRKPLSRTAYSSLPDKFPRVLDSSKLHVSQVYKGYSLRAADQRDMFTDKMWREYIVNKVVLLVDPASRLRDSTIHDCVVVMLYDNRELRALSVGPNKDWISAYVALDVKVDDIVDFKGEVYAVDRKGRVFAISYCGETRGKVLHRSIVTNPIAVEKDFDGKKWLVESSGILYLVHKWSKGSQNVFEVYKLDEEQGCWNQVTSLGDDRLLFVTFDGCFFVSVCDFPCWKGNCIVFSVGSLPCYEFLDNFPRYIALGSFAVDVYMPSLQYWQPPLWLSPDITRSSGEDKLDRVDMEDAEQDTSNSEVYEQDIANSMADSEENEHKTANSEQGTADLEEDDRAVSGGENKDTAHSKASSSSLQLEAPELSPTSLPIGTSAVDQSSLRIYQESSHEEAVIGETLNDPTSRASVSSLTQCTKIASFRKKFKGAGIRPDMIPDLEKIWAKYGDITEGTKVRNIGTIAKALESVAEMVQILQSCSARFLNDGEVEFLSTALFDLQLMGFKVDWLVFSVEKAVTFCKNKSLFDSLMDAQTEKTNVEVRKAKLLDELAKVNEMEKDLNERLILLTEKLSGRGLTDDFDQCLGDGLC